METWLTPDYPDSALQPPGYAVYRYDRNSYITGKSRGGGVCFLINKNWCTDICMISQGSTPNLEFITIKCRPSYLPRDISSVMLTAEYINPRPDTNSAVKDLHNTITKCQNDDPNTVSIVAGGFNQANMESTMPENKQNATCPSRNNRILDHCYCKVKKRLQISITFMLR